MNNVLNRRFTSRERWLMLVLALILVCGLYFLVVHYPITQRMEEIEIEMEEIASDTDIANVRYTIYQSMKNELDEIFAMPEDELTVMPEYDNLQTLMVYFNTIFAGTDPSFNFDQVRINGNVATRTIRFSFTASDYYKAKDILHKLTDTGYRCLLDNVSFGTTVDEVEVGELKISGTITFYELVA